MREKEFVAFHFCKKKYWRSSSKLAIPIRRTLLSKMPGGEVRTHRERHKKELRIEMKESGLERQDRSDYDELDGNGNGMFAIDGWVRRCGQATHLLGAWRRQPVGMIGVGGGRYSWEMVCVCGCSEDVHGREGPRSGQYLGSHTNRSTDEILSMATEWPHNTAGSPSVTGSDTSYSADVKKNRKTAPKYSGAVIHSKKRHVSKYSNSFLVKSNWVE